MIVGGRVTWLKHDNFFILFFQLSVTLSTGRLTMVKVALVWSGTVRSWISSIKVSDYRDFFLVFQVEEISVIMYVYVRTVCTCNLSILWMIDIYTCI